MFTSCLICKHVPIFTKVLTTSGREVYFCVLNKVLRVTGPEVTELLVVVWERNWCSDLIATHPLGL